VVSPAARSSNDRVAAFPVAVVHAVVAEYPAAVVVRAVADYADKNSTRSSQ